MRSKHILGAIQFLLFVTVVGTPLFYLKQGVYPYILSKTAFFQGIVELLFALWLGLAISDKRYRPRFTPAVIGLATFLLVLGITSALGVDPWRSFWSTQERALGIFALLHLVVFALVLSALHKEVPWRPLFYASLGTTLFIDVIAVLQLWSPTLLLQEDVRFRPGATFGNPAFLAGYLIFNVFLAAFLLLKKHEAKPFRASASYAFLATSLIANVITIFITQTRGAILGLAVGLFTLLLLFAFRPPQISSTPFLSRRRFYAGLLGAVVLFGAIFWTTRSSELWDRVRGLNRFRTLSVSSLTSELQPRLIALRAAWKGFKERPLRGWGWENYTTVFNKYYEPRALEANYKETRFDKPHNFLAEYAVAGGVPLLLAYLAFFVLMLWEAWKLRERLLGQIMIAAFLAYAAQNVFVFDTLGPLLMFYLFLGYADGGYRRESEERAAPLHVPQIILYPLLIAAVIAVYMVNILTMQATYYQFMGFQHFVNRRPAKAIESFKQAVGTWTPYRWNLERDYATTVVSAYFYNPGLVPKEEAELAVKAMEESTALHPMDAYGHYVLVDLYNQVSDIDPEKYRAAAEREGAIALQLSPDRQQIYFSLAKTRAIQKDYEGALKLVKYALDLDPKVADAHFYYGLLAFAAKKPGLGTVELKKAVELGRRWKDHNEAIVAANYFADAGELGDAIGLYQKALELQPDNLEAKVKLGLAYFFAGNRDLARQYLEEVARKFNLKSSPSYSNLKPIFDNLGISIP